MNKEAQDFGVSNSRGLRGKLKISIHEKEAVSVELRRLSCENDNGFLTWSAGHIIPHGRLN